MSGATRPDGVPRATVVLVPIKAFAQAKGRLAQALSPGDRAALARRMAARVIDAGAPLPVSVVCDDDEVAAFARRHGAEVLWRPAHGLNPAVTSGVAELAAQGAERVIVAHADLPLASELAWVGAFVGVTIVPDRRDEGTNVIAVPAAAGFRFDYGVGSFRRHAAEARRLALPLRVARDQALGWDVDEPTDLELPADASGAPSPRDGR